MTKQNLKELLANLDIRAFDVEISHSEPAFPIIEYCAYDVAATKKMFEATRTYLGETSDEH